MTTSGTPALYATTYDRSQCTVGVVHLGFGAFHRSHQAVYIDDTMDKTGDLSWGIAAVNLRAPEAAAFAEHTGETDGYIIKAISPAGDVSYRSVRSHVEYQDWSGSPTDAEALLARPEVKLVTITVTESGYYTDDKGALNPEHPVIAGEIAGDTGTSVFAYLANALTLRMAADGPAITIMCCDNIRQNGKKLEANLLSYLKLSGRDDLVTWLGANATFPCSMVDRITPRSTQELRDEVEGIFGASPASPTLAETFTQWVIHDHFAGPMPDFEKAGATITDDVDPYEETKIRILNGGHTCVAYLAALEGLATFDEAMRHPELFAHFWNYETNEVLPALTLDLPFDKAAYLDSIAERFKNKSIADAVARICADGMAKFPIFIRPTIEGCYAAGNTPVHAIRSIASWYVFAQHIAAKKLTLNYVEPGWDILQPMLTTEGLEDFVTSQLLWADLPTKFPAFKETLRTTIKEMEIKWPV